MIELMPTMIARPIACSDKIVVNAQIEGDSRTQMAYALFSIASIIWLLSQPKSLCGASQTGGHPDALCYGLFVAPIRLELEEDQDTGRDGRAERHQDRDRGHAVTGREQ